MGKYIERSEPIFKEMTIFLLFLIITTIITLSFVILLNIKDLKNQNKAILAQLNSIQIQTTKCYPHPYTIRGNPMLEEKVK